MNWTVSFKKQARKQVAQLPQNIQDIATALVLEMENNGPVRYNWPNFGKLKGTMNQYHCHIKTGKPTYVACWEVQDKKIKIIEVNYVGTHEKAPY